MIDWYILALLAAAVFYIAWHVYPVIDSSWRRRKASR